MYNLFKFKYHLAVNCILMMLFVFYTSSCFKTGSEDISPTSFGCMLNALYIAVPCLFFAVISNFIWLVKTFCSGNSVEKRKQFTIIFLVSLLWGILYLYVVKNIN
ncbi:hypothetical protein SAMN02745724_04792 [Pseudoalteromonas denitrificans DSM 6059]|uniref:Uncharacterized protein n=1 Tax=Pseudoalteromonas denitrificans DSM 6059 TaxID=1123010 RepID=A0A1I1T9J9_9GAMM|nr:hypothetical protein SAMN02745724_04792 [Pseudoalteromonas denitrificans DSM 6059]